MLLGATYSATNTIFIYFSTWPSLRTTQIEKLERLRVQQRALLLVAESTSNKSAKKKGRSSVRKAQKENEEVGEEEEEDETEEEEEGTEEVEAATKEE